MQSKGESKRLKLWIQKASVGGGKIALKKKGKPGSLCAYYEKVGHLRDGGKGREKALGLT